MLYATFLCDVEIIAAIFFFNDIHVLKTGQIKRDVLYWLMKMTCHALPFYVLFLFILHE